MSDAIAQHVEQLIANKSQRALTALCRPAKSYCPHCANAVQTLKDLAQCPLVVQLDQVPQGSDQHDYLKQKTGQRTVPAIFIKSKFIGGNSDLQALHAKNELKPLL